MSHGGKGDSPRPFSISQEEYGNRFEAIFGKRRRMPSDYKDNGEDVGTCGCGRSPTGKCIGWHSLSEDEYKENLAEYIKQEGNTRL